MDAFGSSPGDRDDGCDDDRVVTWRLEIMAGWGQRLDPAWLPSTGTEAWRRVFETEDLAGRAFAAGADWMAWSKLAEIAAGISEVLEHYRVQWRSADDVARACPVAADAHVAAMAVPAALRAPRRTLTPPGAWRVCGLDGSVPVVLGEYGSADLGEGAAVAFRCRDAERAVWAEPVARGPAPVRTGEPGWIPGVDTDLRLTAFAAEDAVADVLTAATTGHLGPDVVPQPLLATFGRAVHFMIREYRTILRGVWTSMEACPHAQAHDDDVEALLETGPRQPDKGPGGRWHHCELVRGRVRVVNRHAARTAAAASVAAYRTTDEPQDQVVRWSEPAVRLRQASAGIDAARP